MDDVLVDRRGRRDAGSPTLRPGRRPARPNCCQVAGDRARVAGQDRDVEPPDVDPELEGVGGDDAEDLAVAEAALDRPPLGRQVAAAVAADPRPRPEVLAQRLAQARSSMISTATRVRPNTIGLAAGPQERQRPALGERQRRAAGPGRPDRGSADRRAGRGARRPAPRSRSDPDRPTGEHLRELARVPDRRRAADDDRVAAVVGADAGGAAGARWPRALPNTPRYVCSSSMTMTRSCSNSWNHLVWWGRIAEWSMSGLVTTTCPALRMADRIGCRRVAVVGRRRDLQAGARWPSSANSATWSWPSGLGREQEQAAGRRVRRRCAWRMGNA